MFERRFKQTEDSGSNTRSHRPQQRLSLGVLMTPVSIGLSGAVQCCRGMMLSGKCLGSCLRGVDTVACLSSAKTVV